MDLISTEIKKEKGERQDGKIENEELTGMYTNPYEGSLSKPVIIVAATVKASPRSNSSPFGCASCLIMRIT